MKIIGISGSLREKSFNTALLRAAAGLAPEKVELEIASLQDIPLYNGDVEDNQGIPASVENLKDRIISSDGILLAIPEYNGQMPGVLKNALDWLTRPYGETARVFGGRCAGIIGATPGISGTRLAQNSAILLLHTFGMKIFSGSQVLISFASKAFDAEGRLVDEAAISQVAGYMEAYARFISGSK